MSTKEIFLGLENLIRARICRAVVDLSGEEPAKASLLKCVGTVLIMTTIEQIAEAHVFAEKSGLGTKHMASLIETMFRRPPHTVYSSKIKAPNSPPRTDSPTVRTVQLDQSNWTVQLFGRTVRTVSPTNLVDWLVNCC